MQDRKYKRLIAVGDIHGCLEDLKCLIAQLGDLSDTLIVFLGDYIDRGPNSRGVLDYLIQLKERYPHFIMLKGNHEDMLIDAMESDDCGVFRLYIRNGGMETLANYGYPNDLPSAEHLAFIRGLPTSYETDEFFFAHAGIDPQRSLNDQDDQDLMWVRRQFLDSPKDFGKTIIHGHTPCEKPEILTNRINLDTGCVFRYKETLLKLGKVLTAYDLYSKTFWRA